MVNADETFLQSPNTNLQDTGTSFKLEKCGQMVVKKKKVVKTDEVVQGI